MTPRRAKAATWSIKGAIFGCVAFAIVATLLFPAIDSGCIDCGPRPAAKYDVLNLCAAIKAYNTEYGHYPLAEGGGVFTTEQQQGKLMRVLKAEDVVANPSKIVFFEGKTANERKIDGKTRYISGFSPITAAFMDGWGNPYHVVVDADYDGQISSPYADDDNAARTGVIAWSLGKDRVQGSPANRKLRAGSDDVISWQ